MSISKKVIFCEGKAPPIQKNEKKKQQEENKGSLDYRILDSIIADMKTSEPPMIVSSGGKFTLSIFAEGYFAGSQSVDQQYIIFRDRDFDLIPTDDVQLLSPKKQTGTPNIFLTYRTCIENYLLDAKLIDHYWHEKYQESQEYPFSKWGHNTSPGITKITEWIKTSAENLRDYQIVRWALADLTQIEESRVQLKTTWTGGSGKLPESLSSQDCQQEALKLLHSFRAKIEKITDSHFQQSLDKYQKKFTETSFWQNEQYLIWFSGKDLQKMMQRQKNNYISLATFFDWAVDRLNRFDFHKHPDLVELRTQIEKLITS